MAESQTPSVVTLCNVHTLCISSKVMPIPEYSISHPKDKVRITIAWSEALGQEIESKFMDEQQKKH